MEHEHLWGELARDGWALRWFGIRGSVLGVDSAIGWSQALAPGQIHLVFNLFGQAVVMGQMTRLSISGSMLAMCYPSSKVTATRIPDGSNHEFIVLTMAPEWLKKTLGSREHSIYPSLRERLRAGEDSGGKPVGMVRSMSLDEKNMARQLADPPVEEAALAFWYAAKVIEIIALHLFSPSTSVAESPFCVNQKLLMNERVDTVMEWLEDHLDEPLDLAKLAAHVGCAPHYLSRLFSKEQGMTISQQFRALRVERAAQLMDSGRFNVTEAAMEVGYSSLSHFTKVFMLEKGIKPSEYLMQKR